jgi:2-oxo-4-hydroxy-4-carboxy-5-ureidoimidazoline decarboxylase
MEISEASDRVWLGLTVADWEEAFGSHPRIGERKARAAATKQSATWSLQEQEGVGAQDATTVTELGRLNAEYEARFGRVFLVYATGKTAAEVLKILKRRLDNDAETELREAVEEQRQITQLRLRKWLGV